jgi:hypothetical protein
MVSSSLLGQQPQTPDDQLIQKAIKLLGGSFWFPDRNLPFGTPKPSPDAPDDFNATNLLVLQSILMAAGVTITVGRLIIRRHRTHSSFGIDDLFAFISMASQPTKGLISIIIMNVD